jgi:uncharacterized membrane protein
MSDDEDDDGNPDLIKRVVRDPQGNRRTDRVLDAIRGRRSAHSDLLPRLVVTLVAVLVLGPALGYLDYGTVAGAVEMLGVSLFAYLLIVVFWVTDRIEEYYEDDKEIAVEELRARYARGELTLEAFQQQVDRVYEEGPGWVFEEGEDEETTDETTDGAAGTDDDPMAILQRRFARGELSEAEYRSRVAALEETMDYDGAGADSGTTAEMGREAAGGQE